MAALRAMAVAPGTHKLDDQQILHGWHNNVVSLPKDADTTKIIRNVAAAAAAASVLLICSRSQASLLQQQQPSISSLVTYVSSTDSSDLVDDSSPPPPPLMMSGMSAKNFDPSRYAGRWFEVASLKRGFSGQGQEDCHCTQGVYRFDEANRAIQVDTFCVHGSPDGYITGIRGKVQCIADSRSNDQNPIKEKCYLRFPTLPFIPRQPYDVLSTDYDNYALVSGAKNANFVQIYSRTPNPGREFIDKWKAYLGELGFDEAAIQDTPQDCQDMSMNELMTMMSAPGMEEVMTNTYNPSLRLSKSVQFDPFTSIVETFKQLVKLYFS